MENMKGVDGKKVNEKQRREFHRRNNNNTQDTIGIKIFLFRKLMYI